MPSFSWKDTCSGDEQITLYHLAARRFTGPQVSKAVQELRRMGLIADDPARHS
jgi:hypothetical protein